MTMLKRHRLAKGLTLRVLAQRIGVSISACSAWETGRTLPSAKVLPRLARALGIDAMALTEMLSPEPTAKVA